MMPARTVRSKRRPPAIRGETIPYATSPYRGRPPLITPAVVVDGVVTDEDRILLIRRRHPPWKGWWALPGGFVEIGESCEEAVSREVLEETGVRARTVGLVGVYSAPGRDPRAHIISIAYRLVVVGGTARGGDDASVARWFRLGKLPRLSADHGQIVREALARAPVRG